MSLSFLKSFAVVGVSALAFVSGGNMLTHAAAPVAKAVPATNILRVTSDALITQPAVYLNKKVQFTGKVAGFSATGLDYKPVERSSKEYVSLVIYRQDVPASYTIPLSELKLFVNRKLLKDLKRVGQNDEVSITGKVVSTALNDAWVDVTTLTVLKSAAPEKAGDAMGESEE